MALPRLPAVALLCCALVACATALPDPASPGAVDVYRRELSKEPKGRRAREVRDGLEEAAWADARRQRTVLALRTFLSEFPTGGRAREGAALLETLRWNAALEADRAAAYEGYLRDEPDGPHAPQAFARLRRARLEEAVRARDAAALRALLAQQALPIEAPRPASMAPTSEGKPADLHDAKWGALREAPRSEGLAALGEKANAQANDKLGAALDRAASGTAERARTEALEAQALSLLEELELGTASAAPLPARGAQLQAWLRKFPTSPRRPDTLARLEALYLGEAVLREDDGQLRALWRGGDPKGQAAAGGALLAKASAALDLEALRELSEGVEPVAGKARELKKALEALPAAQRSKLVAAAKALLLPAPVPSQLAPGLPQRARSIAAVAAALDGERLPGLLTELTALHPLTQLAALDAVEVLLRGLPEDERIARASRLLESGLALAQDGPRLAGLALLAWFAGDLRRGLELSQLAVAREPRSLVSALVAAELATDQGGDPALAPAALELALAAAVALVNQHDPALAPAPSPGMPAGEREPALWGLCAGRWSAQLVWHHAKGRAPEAKAKVALANASRALAEAEKLARQPGACEEVLRARETEQLKQGAQRLQAVEALRKAGPLARAALARALARDPAPSVRAAIEAGTQ